MELLANIRKEYTLQTLDEAEVSKNPILQLQQWLNDAIHAQLIEPTAMALSTVANDGRPSVRIVLLKDVTNEGLVFFTNYNSRKALQIAANPFAAAVLFWPELERQLRVEGCVEKVSSEISDKYFDSRPLRSKLGAWASPQSQVVANRQYVDSLLKQLEHDYASTPITRPPSWGGYVVKPSLFEFWQGRESRLHDRIQYRLSNGVWVIERLAP